MKNKSRWLAGLLAATLVINLFVGATWADEESGTIGDPYESAEEFVSSADLEENISEDDTLSQKQISESEEESTAQISSTEAAQEESKKELERESEKESPEETDIEQTSESEEESTAQIDSTETAPEKSAGEKTEKPNIKKNTDRIEESRTQTSSNAAQTNSKNTAETVTLAVPESTLELLEEDAFDTMCDDIFGVYASEVVTEDSDDYSTAEYRDIYIAGSRADELSAPLGSSQKPYTSLDEAYRTEKNSGTEGVIIHLIDDYSVGNTTYKGYGEKINTWPQYELKAVIVSDAYDDVSLEMSSAEWSFPENTGFYQVQTKLTYSTSENACIFANGHTVVFGGYKQNNFAFINTNTARNYPVLFGASSQNSGTKDNHSSVGQTLLKVYGGTWRQIFGGGQFFSDVAGTATTIIDGNKDGEVGEDGEEIYDGAVKFQYENKQKLPFGYYQVYGGGAAQRTSTNEEEYSRVGSTELSISHVSIDGRITPSGGFISGDAVLNMEWCQNLDNASGALINARAEGNAPQKVEFNLDHFIQKSSGQTIGSLYTSGEDMAYVVWGRIEEFDINILDSDVGIINLKYTGQSGNALGNVNLSIKDSTVQQIRMGALWAEQYGGRINSVTLDNVNITSTPAITGSNVDFKGLGTITLKNMGSADAPFKMQDGTWGYNQPERYSPEQVVLENSYVKFDYGYIIGKLSLDSSSAVEIDDNTEINVNDQYTSIGTGNRIILNPGAVLKLNGSVTGTPAEISANLQETGQTASVLWNGGKDTQYFGFAENSNYTTEANTIPSMTYWSVRCGASAEKYVYVDGENGHDQVSEYGETCTEDKLGYNNAYPVRTMDKAYELVQDKNTKIILCGNYVIDFSEENTVDLLNSEGKKKDYQVTISSRDANVDYQISSAVIFRGATETSFLNLNGSFRMENLRLKNEKAQNTFVLCNGFETFIDESVTIEDASSSIHYMGIMGGSKDSGVASTHLEVYNAEWSYIGASGYGKDSYVGSSDENDIPQDTIAYLKADLKYSRRGNYQYNSYLTNKVIYQGSTYGSVMAELNLQEDFCNIYRGTGEEPESKAGTVYGDFTTKVNAEGTRSYVNAKICPSGINVKGETVYSDESSGMGYDYMIVPSATLNTVKVTCNLATGNGAGAMQLFDGNTVFNDIEWHILGKKKAAVYAVDTNKSITEDNAVVKVYVSDREGTYQAVAQNTKDYEKGFLHNKNVKLILENFQNRTLDTVIGFGSVEFTGKGSNILNSEIHTDELIVEDQAVVTAYAPIIIGDSVQTEGKFAVRSGAQLKLQEKFELYGDMEGADGEDQTVGILTNNYTEDDVTAKRITVSGTVSGKTYYTTDYESTEIQVNGDSVGTEYDVPPANEDGSSNYHISCKPETGSQTTGRVWTVTNAVSRKYVYVNGSLDSSSDEYTKHDGSTPDLAYATVEEAYDAVLKNGYIVICGDTEIQSWPTNATKKVTVTSKVTLPTGRIYNFYDGDQAEKAQFKIAAGLLLREDTAFEYLNIYNTAKGSGIIAGNGYQLVMGHEGEADSLVTETTDSGYDLSIAGGTCFNVDTPDGKIIDVKVYSGTYKNIVAGNYVAGSVYTYSYFHPEEITFNIANAEAEYIEFSDDYATYFDKTASCNSLIENTKIQKRFSVLSDVGVDTGKINVAFGKNVQFASDALCILGKSNIHSLRQGNVPDTATISVTIDGTGGSYYTIPTVYCGLYTNNTEAADAMTVNVKLINAGIGKFFGSGISKSECGAGTQTSLELMQNAKVEDLYCGGNYYAGKRMQISVKDQTAQIDTLYPSCLYSSRTPEICEISYENVGNAKQPYTLNADTDYTGFTNVTVKDSYVGLDNSNSSCASSELNLQGNAGIFIDARGYTIKGDYHAAENSQNPGYWYCANAASIQIEGTASGYTKVLSKNTLDRQEEAGKFDNGFSVFAKTNEANSEGQFIDYAGKELDFTTGAEYDRWEIADPENGSDRVNVYVADYGNDIAAGNYSQPVKTLGEAFRKSQTIYENIQKDTELTDEEKQAKIDRLSIMLLTDIQLTEADSEITGLTSEHYVTVKSEDGSVNSLLFSENMLSFGFNTNVRLDSVKIKNTCKTKAAEIYANGYDLEVTENLQTESTTNYYPVLYGGAKTQETASTNLKVYGGKWSAIYGGGQAASAAVTGDVIVTAGHQIDMASVGAYYESSTGLFGGGQFAPVKGKVTVTINGGSYLRIHGGGKFPTASTGEIEVDFNYGKTNMLYGGGEQAASDSIKVNIGDSGAVETDLAEITSRFRGSALYGTLNQNAETEVNIYPNTKVPKNVEFAAGGYSGRLYKSKLNIYGGELNCDIYAGGWGEGTPGNKGTAENSELMISDGVITGNIYGGGNLAIVSGKAVLNINGGTITGNIYGGGNAAGVAESQLYIDSSDEINGNIFGGSYNVTDNAGNIQGSSLVQLTKAKVAGAVFGGSDTSGLISGTVKVEVNGTAEVSQGIYGGGSKAALKICPQVLVDNNAVYTGNIYGGGKGELKVKNRIVRALLRSFTSSDLIDANVPSTSVEINGTVTGDVFGGGEYATVGTADESVSELDSVVSRVKVNGIVNGKVYGGGKGEKDKDYAAINGSTEVTLGAGGNVTVSGNAENSTSGVVFGGGQNAPVAGNTNVNVEEGTYSTIFGGNDVSGEVTGTANVNVTGGLTEHVYGAGRDAAYSGTGTAVVVNAAGTTLAGENTAVTVSEVYGGGYGESAETDRTSVAIQNGTVATAFAGGNAAATKTSSVSVTGGFVSNVFGGGNAATVTEASEITVNTTDDVQHTDTIFAGNNKASMAIKPDLKFLDGKIGTVYCGGNQGVMTYKSDSNKGIEYTFDYPDAEIGTVFAGCNDTAELTSDVKLTLVSGIYGTVYGGNNQNGAMNQTDVIVNAKKGQENTLKVAAVYGGGNQADAVNAAVQVINGAVDTVYGGGNAATISKSVKIVTGDADTGNDTKAKIKNLYCGNNEAEMELQPEIDLKTVEITNFYGGGNKGAMIAANGLSYTFDADDLMIDTIYGGGNEAGVTKSVTLNVNKGTYTTVYGGSNSKGVIDTSYIYINGCVGKREAGTLTGKIFGGGRGSETTVNTANVYLQNGTVSGNVYGGSGFGSVGTANVTAEESKEADAKVQVLGDIFGAGYGVSSFVENTAVRVDLKLNIAAEDGTEGDVRVTETLKSTEDNSGESQAKAAWLNNKSYLDGSYIAGSVYGGGDMGQVGKGYIYTSTNTATIEQPGAAHVTVASGYIHGNVFGGGNGQPGGINESGNAITEYTVYMGTVFGTSNVDVTGGYIRGNVFGCGQQSRTYASEDTTGDGSGDASVVTISTEESQKPILIGGSIFGGGNKGNGSTQNASVATTYGDTHVTLCGKENTYAQIYLLSDGNTGGGVYGDGNLCLVSGKKYVVLENFSCGVGEKASMLKTFYSLQRADVVDLIGSRIVLKGAVDLVAENADDTTYSINRVSQLNMKDSSTIKVTKTVNLLGELTSDEQTERQFIDRGNNTGNVFDPSGDVADNEYTASGGETPTDPLTKDDVTNYISEYNKYIAGNKTSGRFDSINVVCVANGGYLEIKKNADEYGPLTGLFTLQLVSANPGEGGGFVYADIMGKEMKEGVNEGKYVTGNFICVTKAKDNSNDYMWAYHNVGGQLAADGTYQYYVWYLKGNKYSYDVDLTAYIGTNDTDFTKSVSLAIEPNKKFVLTGLKQTDTVNGVVLPDMYQNVWNNEADKNGEQLSVEVMMVTNQKSGSSIKTVENLIGYLGYQTESPTDPAANAVKDSDGKLVWGIWRSDGADGWKFQECANAGENNSFRVNDGDSLAEADSDVVNAQLKFTLHKGTGMTTEFRNLPFEMKIAEVSTTDYDTAVEGDRYIQDDACISLTTNLNLSAIRLVPTQAAYMGSGRMFAGVSSSSTVNITNKSSFTAQFITKYIPSAFNTSSANRITESLETGYSDTYLLDANGVGYTVEEDADGNVTILNVTNTSDSDVKAYDITKNADGNYQVSYKDASGNILIDDAGARVYPCTVETRSSGFTLPRGTMITLLAGLDESNPTYWYYYCTESKTKIDLGEFKKMNTPNNSSASTESVYDTVFTTSSSRVTENMIFVFDFEEVTDTDWTDSQIYDGQVVLKHTYAGSTYRSDIMDYVSSEKKDGDVKYTREMPRSTDTFKISRDSDGIVNFEVKNGNGEDDPEYSQREQMKFDLNITPDTSVTNTQYEEREYAVILELKDSTGSKTAFPEGTVFIYNGEQLPVGENNMYVIVPAGTAGSHEVTIESNLYGFEAGAYGLTAHLYSTSKKGYYNSIQVKSHAGDIDQANFRIVPDPQYALKAEETSAAEKVREKNHLVHAGDAFSFAVTAKGGADTDSVQVQLYKYNGSSYDKIDWNAVLDGEQAVQAGTDQKWTPAVSENAEKGVYRLEFTYHDKTEYWDFVIENTFK